VKEKVFLVTKVLVLALVIMFHHTNTAAADSLTGELANQNLDPLVSSLLGKSIGGECPSGGSNDKVNDSCTAKFGKCPTMYMCEASFCLCVSPYSLCKEVKDFNIRRCGGSHLCIFDVCSRYAMCVHQTDSGDDFETTRALCAFSI